MTPAPIDERALLALLNEYLVIDPTSPTGLRWKKQPSRRAHVGSPAGSKGAIGYFDFRLCKRRVLNHRAIFLMTHGHLPAFVDHIDGDRANNRVENLRSATRTQNNWNSGVRRDSASGVRGVSFVTRTQMWIGAISVNKRLIREKFATMEEAIKWRMQQERIHYQEFSPQACRPPVAGGSTNAG